MKLERRLQVSFMPRVPLLIWGHSGIGKTAIIEAFAKRNGLKVLVPQVRSPEDIAIPVPCGDDEIRVVPVAEFAWACRGDGHIIFLDELTTLNHTLQGAALRFLDSGRVGSFQIPPSVWRVAAANPAEIAAGGWDLAPPTANRVTHVEYTVDPVEWSDGFITYWGDPPHLQGVPPALWEKERALVSAFIRARPALLLVFPKDEAARGKAWPSPRTWDFGSRKAAAVEALGGDEDEKIAEYASAINEPAALEFAAWRKALNLPDPEWVLAHPDKVGWPPRGDLVVAVLASVMAVVLNNPDEARIRAAWKVAASARRAGFGDVAVASSKTLAEESLKRGILTPEVKEFTQLVSRSL